MADPAATHERLMQVYKINITGLLEKWRDNKQDTTTQANIIDYTNDAFFAMRSHSNDWVQKHRTVFCQYIDTQKDIITAICEGAMAIPEPIASSPFVQAAMLVIVNLSDHSRELSKLICQVPGYLKKLYDICDKYKDTTNYDSQVKKLLIRVLMIIHNVAMTDANIPLLQELKFAPVLKNYLSFPNDTIQMTAILGLADIMTEEESHYVAANNEVILFLIKTFEKALFTSSRTAKDRNGMIWGVLELGKGIGRLARNDGNKKLLVDTGSLPLLLKLAKSDDLEEQKEALKSLWALAFNEENQDKIIQHPGLIEFLDNKNRTGFSDTKSTCYGILWTMRIKLQKSDQFKAIGDRLVVKKTMSPSKTFTEKGELETSEKEEKNKGHVMISYQWGDQELLKKVRDRVRGSNKKVWMDIDDMEGSTLQAMADAVENANIVLICMSRKYKDSPNCRAEAEYAHQLRKTVIPLIMERGYKPDGWLGMILGAKLFYDFSGKYPFESKIEGLLREIGQKLNVASGAGAETTGSKGVDVVDGPDEKIVPVQQDMVYAPYKALPPKLGEVKSWSAAQVKDWLKKHGLTGTRVEKLTGREIAFLQKIQASTPEYYYMTIKTDLGLKTLTDLANFEEAMDELPQLS